jgi:glucose-1-phosphate adenylyltransferase
VEPTSEGVDRMQKKECVAMLLAGGEGRRLGALTEQIAKPAVHFGGKYRIIDFTLSNCTNSGIDAVGVLTQYQPLVLNSYIGIGSPWDLDRKEGGVSVLPPYMKSAGGDWYKGTANAIYQNIGFVEQFDPEYLLVISGDHIYKMDYDWMLQVHKEQNADATIAVVEVPWEETSRFGIMRTDESGRITEFAEKPKKATSNLASMGVYMFTWSVLKAYLMKDAADPNSSNDFGKDIIPQLLKDKANLMAYRYEGYWKDVGTIHSLWEANMDLLQEKPSLNLNDHGWRIYSQNPNQPAQYIASTAQLSNSLVNEGCEVAGRVDHSVLFYGVQVAEESHIIDSVIMPNVKIGRGAVIRRSIVGEGTVIGEGCQIGSVDGEITLIPGGKTII